ncbi:AsmA family protein [Burkholderia multivorans]|uniref:AsmA family protein n=1 Tax=Burkholderia multivorans TaxID=87883 RepID=A0A2S9M892_9BURK|nr:AsmA family protein [Burkholderia multivorans]MBU9515655.1 AsmA family protein [Burkholderia multivorans]MBU9525567.1 AsmA family protein [Burkholderia multivorans]MBU9540919.1 AsmA family protein [Burkholderia multivorans]MBU9636473.1 AsmA family protein [Burkholderia multivorans]PRF13352.1 AsmA family protein [Burkholderia multivorans]
MALSNASGRTIASVIGKVLAWLVAVLIILIAAIALFIFTFDWNRARPLVDDKVSAAIGRPFAINGDLTVRWHRAAGETGWRAWVLWPTFVARNITIANPDWTKQRYFATLDQIDFQVKMLPLLTHDIVIPTINLVSPSVDLERLADGRNNWTFKFKSSAHPLAWKLDLHDIRLDKGNIALSDQQKGLVMQVTVNTLGQAIPIGEVLKQQENKSRSASAETVGKRGAQQLSKQARTAASATSATSGVSAAPAAPASAASGGKPAASATAAPASPQTNEPQYGIGWTATGSYHHSPLSGSGKLGGVLALQDASRPVPVQADVKAGDLHVALVGTVTDPAHLAAVDLRLWLQGSSLDRLYQLTGITLPKTPPYATEGHLTGNLQPGNSVFRYEKFSSRVGGSDLNGTLVYTQRKPRPLLRGDVVSNLLQFKDLAPVVGADSNASKAKRGDTARQPANKALPVEGFRTERWSAIDADVKFTGRRIVKDPALPITDLYTHIVMTDGVLSLQPLKFGVAGGSISSDLHLDGRERPLKARATTRVRGLKLKQLLPTVKTMQSALGEVNGDAQLSATGNTPAALAASSNGEVKLLVTDGTLSRLLMEAAGLNVANVVYEKMYGNRNVHINCAAADFVVTDGVLDSHAFALDTDDAVINIDGKVDMKNETMNLGIHPHTKGFRIFTLRSPLYVKGTFKNPHVGVNATALAVRGGAMVGLGLINPFAALIPLIAPSNHKPLPCQQLIAAMQSQQPSAPPPGQRKKSKGLRLPPGTPVSDAPQSPGPTLPLSKATH